MMQIRLMRVLMHQRLVPVRMRMRLRNGRVVRVLVVLVVDVEVLVLERLVLVQVGMLLGSE